MAEGVSLPDSSILIERGLSQESCSMTEGGLSNDSYSITEDESLQDATLHDMNHEATMNHNDDVLRDKLVHNWCDLCHRRNIYMPAHQYCPECLEYYCVDCGDYHSRFALSRNHVVLTGSEMPDTQPVKPLQYEKCNIHVQNHSDQFCTKHKELLCRQCVNASHHSCEIKPVIDVSTNCDSSDVCKFKSLLCEARKGISAKLSVFEQNIAEIESQRKLIEHKLKGSYEAVIFKVNKLFKEAQDELEYVHNKIKTYLLFQISTLNKVISNVDNSLQNLEKIKQMDVKAFLHIQNIAKLAREDIFKINEIHKTFRKRSMKAAINQKLQDFVEATVHLATTEEVMSEYQVVQSLPSVTFPVYASMENLTDMLAVPKAKLKRINRLSAKLPDDKDECGIVGVDVTSDGCIVVADFLNRNVKCFDPCQKYHSSLQMQYQPSDLAVMNNDEAIVSLWCQNELYVLDLKDVEINVRKRIKVDAPVSAISVYKDRIIVNSREGSGSVKMIDKCGKVYWTRNIDSEENELFKHPRCNTCFSYKKKFIAVITDYNKRTIIKLNGRTGDIKTVSRLPEEKDPFGITNDKKGNLYVCYREANEIVAFDADLEHNKVLLSERDGLGVWPNCIKYVASTSQLFVCYSGLKESRNVIDCYQMPLF